jgi:hypothetical protein
MSLKIAKINFSIPAGQTQEFEVLADFYRLETFPTGLLVGLNGGPAIAQVEKFSQQGVPGQGEVRLLRIENPTAGTLAGAFLHGTGQMDLTGSTSISGTVPLPTGAASATNQTIEIGVLTSLIAIAATADLQATGNTNTGATNTALATANAHLANLATSTTRTPRVVAVTPSSTFTITDARYVSITNTGTTDLTIQISGQADFTLPSGAQLDWPLMQRRDTGYTLSIVCPASSAGVIQYIL